jgi:uncharacterized membrane protein
LGPHCAGLPISTNWTSWCQGTFTVGYAISADGSEVAGFANGVPPLCEPIVWTASGGITRLDSLNPLGISPVYGISGDGATIVGSSLATLGEFKAFSWASFTGAVTELGAFSAGANAEAYGVNQDGTVIV